MAKYFVTGATGTVGREVVMALTERGETVIAASREPAKVRELFGDRVTPAAFDYAQADTYDQVAGTAGVFLLGPPLNPALFTLLAPFVDYLRERGPRRVVYLSANGMEAMQELPFHAQMEAKLRDSGLDWRILRPGFFMQNFGNYERENIEQRKVLFSPAGTGKTAFVSARDIGHAAAAVLTADEPEQRIFTLTGTELFSYADVAELLTELLGERITYANPDAATYREALRAGGAPDFIADYMLPVYGLIRNGHVANVAPDLPQLIGREPERLERVLRRDFATVAEEGR